MAIFDPVIFDAMIFDAQPWIAGDVWVSQNIGARAILTTGAEGPRPMPAAGFARVSFSDSGQQRVLAEAAGSARVSFRSHLEVQ